jgi:hypothetical protein
MATALSDKLRIRENDILLTLNAPANFKQKLSTIPKGAKVSTNAPDYNQIHWFVKDRAQMEKELAKVIKLLKNDVLCWIYYPKGTSGIQTDLTRDKGWDRLLAHQQLHWVSLISFDETWSTFACRLKNEKDQKKDSQPKEQRPIFDYIDAKNKIVRLPEDFEQALKKNKKADAFLQKLSFSNKKEYVEWIITAKKDETRKERIKGSIDRLEKQWKNPRNL